MGLIFITPVYQVAGEFPSVYVCTVVTELDVSIQIQAGGDAEVLRKCQTASNGRGQNYTESQQGSVAVHKLNPDFPPSQRPENRHKED